MFRSATHISIYVMINMLNYAFTHILFSLRILPVAAEMSVDRKPDKLLPRIRVTAHVTLKVREEDALNDSLFAPLSKP